MSENNSNSAKIETTNDSKQKKKSKGKKVVLWIIGILLALILALTIFLIMNPHWVSHIKAVYLALTQTEEQLQVKIDKANNDRIEAVQKEGYVNSPEIEAALAEGKITSQQHTQILLGKITLEAALSQTQNNQENPTDENVGDLNGEEETSESDEIEETDPVSPSPDGEKQNSDATVTTPDSTNSQQKDKVTDKTNEVGKTDTQTPPSLPQKPVDDKPIAEAPKPVTPQPPQQVTEPSADVSAVDERIAELITKMYVLKSTYVSQIEGIVAQMKAEFVKLPPEQRTTSAKQSIATGYMSKINAMEAQCDAQVNAVVSELRTLLKKNGRDVTLADTIVSTYNSEKENTKAYYINTYGD